MSAAYWSFCFVLCFCLCAGHFVMVPFNLSCLHCLQHSLFNIYSIDIDVRLHYERSLLRCKRGNKLSNNSNYTIKHISTFILPSWYISFINNPSKKTCIIRRVLNYPRTHNSFGQRQVVSCVHFRALNSPFLSYFKNSFKQIEENNNICHLTQSLSASVSQTQH